MLSVIRTQSPLVPPRLSVGLAAQRNTYVNQYELQQFAHDTIIYSYAYHRLAAAYYYVTLCVYIRVNIRIRITECGRSE